MVEAERIQLERKAREEKLAFNEIYCALLERYCWNVARLGNHNKITDNTAPVDLSKRTEQ